MGVQRAYLSGGRLHLQHGPIDLLIGCDGNCAGGFAAAEGRLETVLAELIAEIDVLRMCGGPRPTGAIARKMWDGVQGKLGFVTPMAGVAGAVAETILESMLEAGDQRRAYVNNGGDIALHLSADATYSVAMSGLEGRALGTITLDANSSVRGIATSGQGGRSLSFGIADSVTVLAGGACQADVAATLIAGAVDLPNHPMISRVCANEVIENSDLGARLIVSHVGALGEAEVGEALNAGQELALQMRAKGHIQAASLHLRGQSRQIDLNTKRVLEHA